MRKLGLSAVAVLFVCGGLRAQARIPSGGFAPGWDQSEKPRVFEGSALFDHIDGGAELYLEFGFRELEVQRYARGDDELVLEIYEMESPESALGLYLMKCGKETPIPGIPARNSSEPAQFTILKARYFIHINNPSGRDDLVPAMTTLSGLALASIPDENARDLAAGLLPPSGLVPGSLILFRGPVGLQSLFTFGEGDILDQKGKIFGVAGTYEGGPEGRYTRIVVEYPDEAAAKDAFSNLSGHLDPYLKVLDRSDSAFVIRDFQEKFGLAQKSGRKIEIRIGLAVRPGLPEEGSGKEGKGTDQEEGRGLRADLTVTQRTAARITAPPAKVRAPGASPRNKYARMMP
jgi:hypothetical protein